MNMGAWGSGPFDNDDAADFAGDLSDLTDSGLIVALLADALLAVTAADGYIEAPEMTRAIAAAAVVALFAQPGLPTPPCIDRSWLDSAGVSPSEMLRNQAAHVLARAFEPQDNEWNDLWAEAGLVDEVRAGLAPYQAALGT